MAYIVMAEPVIRSSYGLYIVTAYTVMAESVIRSSHGLYSYGRACDSQ